jgi:antitoxin (DNA-binding transcriptional repressor) of toxin-antitoxin stability system
MTTIAAGELANQIPQVLQALREGEEFLVTEAGIPVARILPAAPKGVVLEPALTGAEW